MGRASEQTLLWFARVVETYNRMDAATQAELHGWERLHVDGHDVGTSDWPGWEQLVGHKPDSDSPEPPRPTWLYRLFGRAGDLLYIGVTYHWPTRSAQHANSKVWWPDVARCSFTQYPDRPSAEAAERQAIAHESPRHNWARAG